MKSEIIAWKFIDRVVQIVSKEKDYGLSDKEIYYLNSLKKVDIYSVSTVPDIIVLKNSNNEDVALYRIELSSPKVIDPIPILNNQILFELSPVMIIPDRCDSIYDKWVIMHEVCHLLSLGKYINIDNIVFHSFGINQYIYDKQMKLIKCNINKVHNEILNDAIVWYFLELIEQRQINPKNSYISSQCQKIKRRIDIKQIIGLYFSHKSQELIDTNLF